MDRMERALKPSAAGVSSRPVALRTSAAQDGVPLIEYGGLPWGAGPLSLVKEDPDPAVPQGLHGGGAVPAAVADL